MSVPIIYKDTQYIARKHIFKTTLANDTATCNVMTIADGKVGIGTTNPRQLLDIQGGNVITNGNVGIGTTIPLYNLHINGTISAVTYNNLPIISSNVVFKTLTVGTSRTVNWTLPTNFSYITFEMWGGGGSGGSGGYNTAPYYGSGGEGGDYTKITFPVTNFSGINTLTLTIGAGGTSYGDYGDNTSISWGGTYTIQAFGGKGGSQRNTAGTAYNLSQKTYTNRYAYDTIIPGGYGGVYSTNLKNGTNNSIITGISRNYNGTGGGGAGGAGPDSAIPGTGGPGGTNYVIAAIGTAGQNLFSSIETATYGGTYTYIVGGGGGGGGSSVLSAGTGGYPGGGGGGGRAATSGPVVFTGRNGGDGLIRITWY